jgi:hypothetical protein
MAVTPGSKALASEYNNVAELVNKIFGDKYSSASVTDPDRTNHKFGWGGANITDNLSSTTLITADRLQDLVERTNLMVDRININDTILVFAVPTNRIDVLANTPVRAEDLNIVENKLLNSIIANDNYTTVEVPGYADSIVVDPTALNYTRSLPWTNKITGEHKWSFDDYNHARYFFNSGGTLGLSLLMSGGSTAGFYNWADIINEIGTLTFTYNNTIQSSSITQGTSEGKGFYDLTEYYGDGSDAGAPNEGLLFTSSGVTAPSYGYGYGYGYGYSGIYIYDGAFESAYPLGDSGYSSYSQRYVKVYGKHANNGSEVHFKVVLDDTSFSQITDGTLSVSLRYLMPYSISSSTPGVTTPLIPYNIESDVQFDVTPAPIASVVDDFNTGDDS